MDQKECEEAVLQAVTAEWHEPFCTFTNVRDVIEKVIGRLHADGMDYETIAKKLGG